ncbi:hypothetical protein NEISICOT_01338 [Neisseria sicca ATCC 29256]|uniref:Uncharacterized protein n=1 Tax=Neisseria sicca ATCC 29256 TaxID=547045 RepID=C6M495_NEISI|nr:hypothetical protein NEISICOT_01338 [Neisseria sicca ATCC 29256]
MVKIICIVLSFPTKKTLKIVFQISNTKLYQCTKIRKLFVFKTVFF